VLLLVLVLVLVQVLVLLLVVVLLVLLVLLELLVLLVLLELLVLMVLVRLTLLLLLLLIAVAVTAINGTIRCGRWPSQPWQVRPECWGDWPRKSAACGIGWRTRIVAAAAAAAAATASATQRARIAPVGRCVQRTHRRWRWPCTGSLFGGAGCTDHHCGGGGVHVRLRRLLRGDRTIRRPIPTMLL
jgi:hypothetical protein